MRTTESTLDLFGADFVAEPRSVLRELRIHSPVHYEPRTGLWLVSRYLDIRQVLTDPQTFRPDNALTAITPIGAPALRALATAGFCLPPTLANNGTPSHAGLRRLVATFFSPARVRAAVELVRTMLGHILDRVESVLDTTGSCDLANEVAQWLPANVLLRMLDVGPVDLRIFKAWSQASLELFWGNPTPERQRELAAAAGEFHQWLVSQVRSCHGHAGLIPALVAHRTADGRALNIDEVVGVLYFLLIAGQETTTQLLCNLFRQLIGRPMLWQRLSAQEAGFTEKCVEEVLRYEPPVVTWRRITSRPIRLHTVDLPANAPLLLMLSSAGADPEIFAEPDDFCPDRLRNRNHLAFGHGIHFCLGAALARMESAEILRAVARRFPDIRLDHTTDPGMLGLVSFRAPTRVVVTRSGSQPNH